MKSMILAKQAMLVSCQSEQQLVAILDNTMRNFKTLFGKCNIRLAICRCQVPCVWLDWQWGQKKLPALALHFGTTLTLKLWRYTYTYTCLHLQLSATLTLTLAYTYTLALHSHLPTLKLWRNTYTCLACKLTLTLSYTYTLALHSHLHTSAHPMLNAAKNRRKTMHWKQCG